MFDLPKSTVFDRRIPKQKFYEHLSVTPRLKRIFVEQISLIYWQNKIAPATVNVAAGENVEELEIIRIKLNQRDLDKRALQQIDKGIPYHILYLLEYGSEVKACVGFKDEGAGKAVTYYETEWQPPDALQLRLDGLNMDAIYESFIRQIAVERLGADKGADIQESIAKDKQRQKLLANIAALEKKVQREKQFNKQVELNGELKQLRAELLSIGHDGN